MTTRDGPDRIDHDDHGKAEINGDAQEANGFPGNDCSAGAENTKAKVPMSSARYFFISLMG